MNTQGHEEDRDQYGYTKEGVISLARVAFDRGLNGRTGGTADESRHPVHGAAWILGTGYRKGGLWAQEQHCQIACGCSTCRLSRLVTRYSPLHASCDARDIAKQLDR